MSATDETLYEMMIKVENKDIFVDLKKNRGGVYLKISERNGGGRNTVLIPASGIPRLKVVIDEISKENFKAKSISRERKDRIASDPDVTSRSVYVTGLNWETTDEELLQHFATSLESGSVVSAVVLRQSRGRRANGKRGPLSLGCGVVEFDSFETAATAITSMNETELQGRRIRCREDRLPPGVGGGDSVSVEAEEGVEKIGDVKEITSKPKNVRVERKPRDDSNRVAEPSKVFVTSLAWETGEAELKELFGRCGEVVATEVLMTRRGRSMGSGVVEFADSTMAEAAIAELNGEELQGRKISVRQYYQ